MFLIRLLYIPRIEKNQPNVKNLRAFSFTTNVVLPTGNFTKSPALISTASSVPSYWTVNLPAPNHL